MNHGVLELESVSRTADDDVLVDLVRGVLDRSGETGWTVRSEEFWCRVTPVAGVRRAQGWKLHVSATPLSAPLVLARAASVLIAHGCPFKFAGTLGNVEALLSAHYARGGGGKFITAYPADDEAFVALARELDRVTAGLPGPRILSDRRWSPSSLVHFRYGAFTGHRVLTDDGTFETMLQAPDGKFVTDERLAWFSPPDWAGTPVPAPTAAPAAATVRLAGRFDVTRAIRHANRGGVFAGTDTSTGREVVIKQARPYVAATVEDRDARDDLRNEARTLAALADTGLTASMVDLFEQQGELFLAQEMIPGDSLRRWVAERLPAGAKDSGLPWPQVRPMALRLVDLMAAVHGAGAVIQDFNPNNVMVRPDGEVRLIDLEHVALTDDPVRRVHTPGYGAPEQVGAARFGSRPSPAIDLFSLGATLFHLATGLDPMLLPDGEPGRSPAGRLGELVAAMSTGNPALARLAPLIGGLTADAPGRRWSLARARAHLVAGRRANRPARPPAARGDLLDDGLTFLIRQMNPAGARLWTSAAFGSTTDPLNVQHGAAGVLAVLTRAARVRPSADLDDAVRVAAGWVHRRLNDTPRLLPGLYFGRSGAAWALHDAGEHLGDTAIVADALDLAARTPLIWPNPDVSHGLAGAGLTQLHLWRATGEPRFLERTLAHADSVRRAARVQAGQTVWPIPDHGQLSTLAGLVHYGFAHGVAGAGTFLLAAASAGNRPDLLESARAAGRTLAAVAHVEADAAWWPTGPGDRAQAQMQHWCSGASGVGSFLVRLWQATGDVRYRTLAEQAAVTVRRGRWHTGFAACHGLAGDGEFLLDLAEATGEARYREWAEDLAATMTARTAVRDGLTVVGGENPMEVVADYGTGLAGVVGFLLRLRHGGPRPWMVGTLRPGMAAR